MTNTQDPFEAAAVEGCGRLGEGWVEKVYKASLIASVPCARFLVQNDPDLEELWGIGDRRRAVRLIEVIASQVALILLQNECDQERVCAHVALGFADLMGSNPGASTSELLAARLGRLNDEKTKVEGGVGLREWTIIYLRAAKALGEHALDFAPLCEPFDSWQELFESKILTGIRLPAPDATLRVAGVILDGGRLANEAFRRLEETK